MQTMLHFTKIICKMQKYTCILSENVIKLKSCFIMTDMGREARFEITQVIIPGWQSGKNISEVNKMREGIHPKYYQAKVTCNCGNEFVTGSTKPEIHVEICSKCHSFYTGQQKAASARGRIDKFNRKYGIKQA